MESEINKKWNIVLDNQSKENLEIIKSKIDNILKDKFEE